MVDLVASLARFYRPLVLTIGASLVRLVALPSATGTLEQTTSGHPTARPRCTIDDAGPFVPHVKCYGPRR